MQEKVNMTSSANSAVRGHRKGRLLHTTLLHDPRTCLTSSGLLSGVAVIIVS